MQERLNSVVKPGDFVRNLCTGEIMVVRSIQGANTIEVEELKGRAAFWVRVKLFIRQALLRIKSIWRYCKRCVYR